MSALSLYQSHIHSQAQAADPLAWVWVSANAGSGKTRVLVDRIIRLMLPPSSTPASRILCITYTKAAASEMAGRLFKRLGEWAVCTEEQLEHHLIDLLKEKPTAKQLQSARCLFAKALETPGGIKIQTIHAFCESVLKRFPVEAKVAPDFKIMDDHQKHDLFKQAMNDMLSPMVLKDNPTLATVSATVSEFIPHFDILKLFYETIPPFVKGKDNILLAIEALKQGYKETPYCFPFQDETTSVESFVKDRPASVMDRFASLVESVKASDTDKKKAIQAKEILSSLKAEKYDEAFSQWKAFFLTQDGKKRSSLFNKAVKDAMSDDLFVLLHDEQDAVTDFLENLAHNQMIQLSLNVLVLYLHISHRVDELKKQRVLMDYDDLIDSTARLFQDPDLRAWVLYKLDYGLSHVLLDESQDTSPAQWQILKSITDDFSSGQTHHTSQRTVFMVGDDKQSIYSFQGADPDQMQDCKLHFQERAGNIGKDWKEIPLEGSFRSGPAILKFVDDVYALDTKIKARHHAIHNTGPATVELWDMMYKDTSDKDQEKAIEDLVMSWTMPPTLWDSSVSTAQTASTATFTKAIVQRLHQLLDSAVVLPSTKKPVTAGDILILVKDRKNALVRQLILDLKRSGLPLAGMDKIVLHDEMAVQDMMAVVNFALFPEDDLTLACVLKSPLFGISEEELQSVCVNRGGASVWSTLRQYATDKHPLWSDIQTRLRDIIHWGQTLLPYDFLNRVLEDTHLQGRLKLQQRLGYDCVDGLDELLNTAIGFGQNNAPSLQGFALWFAQNEATVKREIETDGNGGLIRVMTIHGAKGLEAPVVIMPDIAQRSRDTQKLFVYQDMLLMGHCFTADDPKPDLYTQAKAQKAEKDFQEQKRLLYVGLTRAKDYLLIAGFENKQPPKADKKDEEKQDSAWYPLLKQAMTNLEEKEPDKVQTFHLTFGHLPEPVAVRLYRDAPKPSIVGELKTGIQAKTILPLWVKNSAPVEPDLPKPLRPSKLFEDDGEVSISDKPLFDSAIDDKSEVPPPVIPDEGEALGKGILLEAKQDYRTKAMQRGVIMHTLLQVLPDCPPDKRENRAKAYVASHKAELTTAEQDKIVTKVMKVFHNQDLSWIFEGTSQAEVSLVGKLDCLKNYVFSGQVDRLCMAGDVIYILDYKSDYRIPSSALDVKTAYVEQLALYKMALQQIYPDKIIKCGLIWVQKPLFMPLPDELIHQAIQSVIHRKNKHYLGSVINY